MPYIGNQPAPQNVTGDGITDGTITNADINASAAIDITKLSTTVVPTSGATLTGALNFGDSVNANFGAGNDLQIYHDGSRSIIQDNGTGNLRIQANNLELNNADNSENYLFAANNGAVTLYYDNAEKLNTTSTGIDVTGRITTDAITEDTSGNVGIGTSSPSTQLHVSSASNGATAIVEAQGAYNARVRILSGNANSSFLEFADPDDSDVGEIVYDHSNNSMLFTTNASERMRIDSSGNLLVGQSSTTVPGAGNTTAGTSIRGTDGVFISRTTSDTSASALQVNKTTGQGAIINIASGGTTVGSIGNFGNYMYLASQGPSAQGVKITDNFIPATTSGANNDNAMDLGGASVRWDDVYATNGTIQTSDRNEKQDIAELSDAEQRVAVAAKGLLRKFRWKDAVAEKGDEARTHFGIIAQDLQAAFAAEGLDAGDYAMFISSTWTDEETGEERTRMGVRYSELLAFIIAAI